MSFISSFVRDTKIEYVIILFQMVINLSLNNNKFRHAVFLPNRLSTS